MAPMPAICPTMKSHAFMIERPPWFIVSAGWRSKSGMRSGSCSIILSKIIIFSLSLSNVYYYCTFSIQ